MATSTTMLMPNLLGIATTLLQPCFYCTVFQIRGQVAFRISQRAHITAKTEHRFGYRYAIVALVNAGFRCIAPSQLGYYPSSQPDDIAAYGFRAICRDTEELLTKADAPQQILLVGHDW